MAATSRRLARKQRALLKQWRTVFLIDATVVITVIALESFDFIARTDDDGYALMDLLGFNIKNAHTPSRTNAASLLSARLGLDVSGFPLDEKVPDLPLPNTSHGFARAMLSKARREGMTWRDLHNLTGGILAWINDVDKNLPTY